MCTPLKKTEYLALAVIRTISRTGRVRPGLLVGAPPVESMKPGPIPVTFSQSPRVLQVFVCG